MLNKYENFALAEKIKQMGADRFFNEFDLPEKIRQELKDGWRLLEERKKARQEAGVPLPEGGCLVLGESSVVAQGLAEFHQELAKRLNISLKDIRLRLEGKQVVADVSLPDHWFGTASVNQKLFKDVVGDRAVMRLYLEPIIADLNVIFFKSVKERWSSIRLVRESLVPLKENGESWLNG